MNRLTLRDGAKAIGIGYATLSRIERGMDMDGRTLARVFAWLTREERAGKGAA